MLNFGNRQTTLDLNGPVISIIQQPSSVSVCNGGDTTFIGIATVSFPTQTPENNPTNTGILTQRWYSNRYGPLIDGVIPELGVTISGSGTTTLTISDVISPTANGIGFFMRPDYIPSAYSQPVGSTVVVGTARSTGNANNEPFDTSLVTLTVRPTLTVTKHPTDQTAAQTVSTTFTTAASITDTTQGSVSYQWQLNGVDLSNSSTVSGAQTQTLTISLSTVGENSVRAKITHPTSCDSPLYTNAANFNVVSARQIINYETFNDNGGFSGSGSQNLFDSPITFTADPANATRALSIYPPEKNLRIRATMSAAAGANRNGNSGGQGGSSVFEFTMEQNNEYLIKLGAQTPPTGGANGGGGAAYLYKKGRLLVAIGGGGGAGNNGKGGDGGGISIAGQNGQGRSPGVGGELYSVGNIPVIGVFPGGSVYGGVNWTAPDGGRISGCTLGEYWTSRGISPCSDIGITKFVGGTGTVVNETAEILRGYKPGIGHRNNGGNGSGDNGGGGSGAAGGDAGTGSGSGGGGGSGYSSGDVDVISSQLGGNTSINAFVTLEAIQVSEPPVVPEETFQVVRWDDERNPGYKRGDNFDVGGDFQSVPGTTITGPKGLQPSPPYNYAQTFTGWRSGVSGNALYFTPSDDSNRDIEIAYVNFRLRFRGFGPRTDLYLNNGGIGAAGRFIPFKVIFTLQFACDGEGAYRNLSYVKEQYWYGFSFDDIDFTSSELAQQNNLPTDGSGSLIFPDYSTGNYRYPRIAAINSEIINLETNESNTLSMFTRATDDDTKAKEGIYLEYGKYIFT